MKNSIYKTWFLGVAFVTLFAISNSIFAQPGHWRLGGNPAPPPAIPDAVDATNNIFGTLGNFSLNLFASSTPTAFTSPGAFPPRSRSYGKDFRFPHASK